MSKQKYPQAATHSTDGTSSTRKGREHYSHAKLDARIGKRQKEADARQRVYDGLSIKAKLALVKTRPGENKRELTRLNKQLESEKAPVQKATPLTSEQKAVKTVKRSKAAAALVPKHKK